MPETVPPQDVPLDGRVALVTGGGRGIGRAIALALGNAGAGVAVAARHLDQVTAVAREVEAAGRPSAALVADVTLPDQARRIVQEAATRLGPVDILVNCAGAAESAPLTRTDTAMWDRMISANLTSVYLCSAAALPSMLERSWGRVISIASLAGLHGYAYVAAYCAAKHGVVGFTRALALEVAAKGVTVNAVCPGYVDTDMTRRSAERIAEKTGMPADEARGRLAAQNPSGRLTQPEEVAAVVLRLALPEASHINGEAIEV